MVDIYVRILETSRMRSYIATPETYIVVEETDPEAPFRRRKKNAPINDNV